MFSRPRFAQRGTFIRRARILLAASALLLVLVPAAIRAAGAGAPPFVATDVTRMWFSPTVIPENYTQPVLFQATVVGLPSGGTMKFAYNALVSNTDVRQMYDDGTHGDLVAGDGTWSITFQPSEILGLDIPADVFRPFVGFVQPTGAGNYNIFGGHFYRVKKGDISIEL